MAANQNTPLTLLPELAGMAIGVPPWLRVLLKSRTVWVVLALCLSHGLLAHWADGRGYDRRVAFEAAAAAATNEAIDLQAEQASATIAQLQADLAAAKKKARDSVVVPLPEPAAVFAALPAPVAPVKGKPKTKRQPSGQPPPMQPRSPETIDALNQIRVMP